MDLDEFLLENEIPITLEEEEEMSKCPEAEWRGGDTQDSSDEPATVPQMPEEEHEDEDEPEDDPLAVSVETEAGEVTNTHVSLFVYH